MKSDFPEICLEHGEVRRGCCYAEVGNVSLEPSSTAPDGTVICARPNAEQRTKPR